MTARQGYKINECTRPEERRGPMARNETDSSVNSVINCSFNFLPRAKRTCFVKLTQFKNKFMLDNKLNHNVA